MRTVTWDREARVLDVDGRKVVAWSKVRNELNGLRPRVPLWAGKTDVYLATGGIPAMPRVFPMGHWKITGFKEHPDPAEDHGYLYPVFIRTNAFQMVPEWELDGAGRYFRPTGREIRDEDYGLHFSTSDWTQGCGRVKTLDDITFLWHTLEINDEFIVI